MIINKLLKISLLSLTLLSLNGTLKAQGEEKNQQTDRYLNLIDSSFVASSASDYALAETYLRKAINFNERHPLNTYLLNNLGGLQQIQGKLDEALMSYSAALTKNPDEQTIRFNRARLYALRGKHKAAITDFSILLSLAPNNELYHYQRAMSCLLAKDYGMAELDLMEILKLSPKSLKARIGLALLHTMKKDYDKAEQIYDYLVQQLPQSAEVYEGRARMYLARDMKGFAIRDMNKAFELSKISISPSLYRLRAEVNEQIGEKKKAEEDLERALKLELSLDPTSKQRAKNE